MRTDGTIIRFATPRGAAARARARAMVKDGIAKAMRAMRAGLPRPAPNHEADPQEVARLVMAIDRLTAASFRASCYGRPVTVTVPDRATAALFEAALAQTRTRRATDSLIRVVVDTPVAA
ncbi:MAG: hypothetical protein AB7G39_15865 [Alphaproteobacteria bacterium]